MSLYTKKNDCQMKLHFVDMSYFSEDHMYNLMILYIRNNFMNPSSIVCIDKELFEREFICHLCRKHFVDAVDKWIQTIFKKDILPKCKQNHCFCEKYALRSGNINIVISFVYEYKDSQIIINTEYDNIIHGIHFTSITKAENVDISHSLKKYMCDISLEDFNELQKGEIHIDSIKNNWNFLKRRDETKKFLSRQFMFHSRKINFPKLIDLLNQSFSY